MAEIRISVTGKGLAEALRRAPAQVAEHVDQELGRGALEVSRELRREAPKAQSTLVNSIAVTHEGRMNWRVAPAAEHAWYVERGRRPGGRLPPPSALADWAMTKLRITDPRERRSVGFALARTIQRKGIPARPFIAPLAQSAHWQQRIAQLAAGGIEKGLRAAGLR